MIGAIKQTTAETITVETTASRQTPRPPSEKFGEVLKQGAMAMLAAAGGAATALPCGGILSAAVRAGTASALEPVGQQPSYKTEDPRSPAPAAEALPEAESGLGEMWQLQEEGVRSNLEMLRLQEQIGRENRVFTTISNVMKARHETAQNAISNIR